MRHNSLLYTVPPSVCCRRCICGHRLLQRGHRRRRGGQTPSRGFVRSPACSPSPLKRASPTPGNCFSPTPRTGEGTSRKLDLLPVEAPEHHPLVAAVTSSPVLKDVSDGFTEACAKSLLQHRIRVQPEPRPHLAKSTATPVANTQNLNAAMWRRPPRGSRSLSTCGPSDTTTRIRGSKRKVSGGERVSEAYSWGSVPHHRSRRDDIFKGLAKLKARKVAKLSDTKSDKP